MISDLTYKVVAYTVDPSFNSDECVDWAIEMLELGHETESLLVLAGLSKPTNHFETTDYLRRALRELGLDEKTESEGVFSYVKYYIYKISRGENIRQNLKNIQFFCQSKGYEKSIYDFYLLYWAWDDLDYGNEHQSYWPEADKNNIENIIIEKAKNWIAENESHCARQKP
jgi:hypothetical protein